FFFFYSYTHPRDLHTLPTRRSSDLAHGYAAMPLTEQLPHQKCVQPGPLVLRLESLKFPAPTVDKDRTVSRRSEPSSRTALTGEQDRKSTRLNSSHDQISYAVFCLKK